MLASSLLPFREWAGHPRHDSNSVERDVDPGVGIASGSRITCLGYFYGLLDRLKAWNGAPSARRLESHGCDGRWRRRSCARCPSRWCKSKLFECPRNAPSPHSCGGSGPLEMLDALLAAGAACDASDSEGWTALHYASSSGQGELVARLIKAGAPLNAVTRDRGWTPLTRAAFRSCPHVIVALLAAGADSSLQTEVSLRVARLRAG